MSNNELTFDELQARCKASPISFSLSLTEIEERTNNQHTASNKAANVPANAQQLLSQKQRLLSLLRSGKLPFHQVPYACLYIDATLKDWMAAVTAALMGRAEEEKLQQQIADFFNTSLPSPPSHHTLTCLSVRSALDLYLRIRRFHEGSVLLMSAINIPDMSIVVREHGLIPVPIDVDVQTMAPCLQTMRSLLEQLTQSQHCSSNAQHSSTRRPVVVAMLLAHVFGRRFSMQPYAELAREFNIELWEDSAECFQGNAEQVSNQATMGCVDSDLVLFSFGSIKTCTTFGGGVVRVKNKIYFEQMQRLHQSYTRVSRFSYFNKCLKNSVIMLMLNVPLASAAVMRSSRVLGVDHKALVVAALRGFPDKLIGRIRHSPSIPLLMQMQRRFHSFDYNEVVSTRHKGDIIATLLQPAILVPGLQCSVRHYWLYPILVYDAQSMIAMLNALGVDAYRGATQLDLVKQPSVDEERKIGMQLPKPRMAAAMMKHVVYLPVHRHVPVNELIRIAACVEFAQQQCNQTKQLAPLKSRL